MGHVHVMPRLGSVANRRTARRRFITYFLLIAFSFAALLPFAWMLVSSFKNANDVFTYPMKWWPEEFVWRNYTVVFDKIPFALFMGNSFKVSVFATLLQLLTSSLAAYGFSKMRFPGRNALFFVYVATIAIPWHAYMVPQYFVMRTLNLTNKHLGLIILFSFSAFGVFLVRQFYTTIPDELCEAARIDGLSEYGIYARIMLPLSKPVLATLAVFSFVGSWNDYLGSMIYISSDVNKLIQAGLRLFITTYSADYSMIMTGCVISLIPILVLFLFSQRFFIEGIATTGIKG